MSNLTRKRRLSQAQQITALKERRAERARIVAVRAEREARNYSQNAAARREVASANCQDARSAFFKLGGAAEAEVWLIAQEMRETQAIEDDRSAAYQLNEAQDATENARRDHERLRERVALIDTQLTAVARSIAGEAETREDEDMQEQVR